MIFRQCRQLGFGERNEIGKDVRAAGTDYDKTQWPSNTGQRCYQGEQLIELSR